MSFRKQHPSWTIGLTMSSGIAVIATCMIAFQVYSTHLERIAVEKCEAMTPGERRESLIRSLIELKKRNAELSNGFAGRGIYRVGIAHNFSESGAKDIVAAAYESHLSFENNFDITRLDMNGLDVETKWRDGDALVSYSTHENTTADFIPFLGVVEVVGVEQTGHGVGRFIPGRKNARDKYHVFSMENISVVRDCCSGHERTSGPDDDHVRRKLAAYRQTMAFFSPEFNGRDLYINTSSCGMPSTEDGDNNMGTRRLDTFMIIKRKEVSEKGVRKRGQRHYF
ncbi:hypothetical protein [Rhodanobacter sp. TND4FH1]